MMTSTVAPEGLLLNDSMASTASTCLYEEPPLTTLRFWVVTVFGTTIALCSIVENLFFLYLFASRRHHRLSFNMYMLFISLFDIFISTSYILIQSMNVLMDYLQSLTLFRIWHIYMIPFLTISHCAITSGSFLILAATIERYLLTANASKYIRFVQRYRFYIIMAAILMAIASKVTICLEFKISYKPECANTMSELDIGFADFVFDTDYHLYWRFYYRNFVTIFFPFFALLTLNAKIIRLMAKFEKENYKFQILHSATATAKHIKRKKVTRAATVTTILLVCSYLVSNIISVALTTWEHIDKPSLVGEYIQIYFISIDLSSLLIVCSCAFRPLIYLICQPGLRKEVFGMLKHLCHIRGDIDKHRQSTQFTTAGFEPMYNSNDLSTPCQPSPATPYGNHPLVPGANMAYPLVPRRPTIITNANNIEERMKLLTINNHNNNNIANNNLPIMNGQKSSRRASLGVEQRAARRRRSSGTTSVRKATMHVDPQLQSYLLQQQIAQQLQDWRKVHPQQQLREVLEEQQLVATQLLGKDVVNSYRQKVQTQHQNGSIAGRDPPQLQAVHEEQLHDMKQDPQQVVAQFQQDEHEQLLQLGGQRRDSSSPATTPPINDELLRNLLLSAGGDETHL